MRNFMTCAASALLMGALCLPLYADDDTLPVDPTGCHFIVKTESDDANLLKQVRRDIGTNPAMRPLRLELCLSIKKIENGYVTLIVQHGHGELSHWLAHDPVRLKQALENGKPLGTLFASAKTRNTERQQVSDLFKLARAIEKNPAVKGVYWAELPQQKKFCPICNPPKKKEWLPRYYFHYPQHLGTEDALEMLTSLGITIAMPMREKNMLLSVPSHRYVLGAPYRGPYGAVRHRHRIIWHPKNAEARPGGKPLVIRIEQGQLCYSQSRAILRWCGMWDRADLGQKVFHLYSEELQKRMITMWKERRKNDIQVFPDLRSQRLRYASFGFRQLRSSKWEVCLMNLGYY